MRSVVITLTVLIRIVLLTLFLTQITIAQDERVQSSYLEDKNVTEVMLRGIKIPNNKDNFSIGAAFVFEGKHLSQKPCCVTLLMSSFSTTDRKYEKNHNLTLWADNAQLRKGPINYSWNLFGTWLQETMWIDISYETFSKLANSKKAKAKLGSFKFELTQEQLEGLRELESKMVRTAADFDPFEGPKPLAIFIQSNPWAMVIGSDTPRVAIYENGDVVFVKKVNDRLAYHHVTLDTNELEKVREQLKLVLALKDLKPWYDVRPYVTDQPEAMFYFHDGNREFATSVYGLIAGGTKLPGYTKSAGGAYAIVPPDELLKLHKWLSELDYSNSKEWTPKYVEVMLWDYSYAPEASIQWPKDWPSLNSDRTVKRGGSYSIFLDGLLLPKLREFLATRKERGAVQIEGKKMAASYRFTFPGERTWHKAFAEAAKQRARQ